MLTRARLIVFILCVLLVGCSKQTLQTSETAGESNAGAKLTLVGAGSSFDFPFFSRAFYEYSKMHPEVAVNYQSIGSGGGIRQFSAGTVDFGATDVPMSAKELAAVPKNRTVIQAPVTLGGVAIAYNVAGAPAHLKLTPGLLADIYLGKVLNWSDPQIARVNPGANLKSLQIAVIHRADGSGTTYIFTDYFSQVSPEWKARVGTGKTVSWVAQNALGAKGTEGVAGQVRNTPGAIGYIELAYAMQNNMAYAMLQNKAGRFVLPTVETVAAAAAAKPNVTPKDFSIVNQSGPETYPIAGYSWVLLYQHYPDAKKQQALHDLFAWLLTDGQQLSKSIDYVPLPPAASKAAVSAIDSIRK